MNAYRGFSGLALQAVATLVAAAVIGGAYLTAIDFLNPGFIA